VILRFTTDTNETTQVPIKYAHIHRGVLMYRIAGTKWDAGMVDLDRTRLVEFEADVEPDKPGS
jgi:hypothetical protein